MKTIIIGLGTTGLSILNHIQQFYYEFTGNDKPANVEYLFCETDIKGEAAKMPCQKESPITKVFLDLQRSQEFIHNYQNPPAWFPDEKEATALGTDGANGVSKYGRLSLWMNWPTVEKSIEIAHRGGSDKDTVFILGSFMGGTCSGTFIDVAYLAQKVTGSDKIFGFFLIPPANDESKSTVHSSYLNALASLKHYQKGSSNMNEVLYQTRWPGSHNAQFATKPYKHVFLFSREYKAWARTDNDNVIRTIGLHICTRLMDNSKFQDKLFAKLTDIANKEDFNYSTIGSMLISHPATQLQQIAGLEICKEIIEDWNNEENFFNNKQRERTKIEAHLRSIIRQYNHRFEDALLHALNCQDESNLFVKVRKEIDRIVENRRIGELQTLFSFDSNNNLYGEVCLCKSTFQEHFIDSLYDICVEIMKEYQNVHILSGVLKSWVGKPIDFQNGSINHDLIGLCSKDSKNSLLGFWFRKYRLSEDKNSYLKAAKGYLTECIDKAGSYKVLGEQKNYLEEAAQNALMFCKLHVGIEILKEIKSAVLNGEALHGANNPLIHLQKIETIKQTLAHLVSAKQTENNLPTHVSRLKDTIQPDKTNLHFSYLFESNLEEDIKKMLQEGRKQKPEIHQGELLPYLLRISIPELFADCLNATRNLFENHKERRGINDIINRTRNNHEVFDKVKVFFDNPMVYATTKEKLPSLLKLHNTDFEHEANLQLVYAMSNFSGQPPIAGENSYLAGIGDPTTNTTITNGIALSDLKNLAIVVFQQYSQKDNNKWIDAVADIEQNYYLYKKVDMDTLAKSNPYLSKDQIEGCLGVLKSNS